MREWTGAASGAGAGDRAGDGAGDGADLAMLHDVPLVPRDPARAARGGRAPHVVQPGEYFSFTWKSHGAGGTKACWQATCTLPGHDSCRRTRSLLSHSDDPHGADSLLILRRLKLWCLAGMREEFRGCPVHGRKLTVDSKKEHQELPRSWMYTSDIPDAEINSACL